MSFFFLSSGEHSVLHSFPTRRSSDLFTLDRLHELFRSKPGPCPVAFELRYPDGSIATLEDRKSTRLNSSHVAISYAVFCLKKKTNRVAALSIILSHLLLPPRLALLMY